MKNIDFLRSLIANPPEDGTCVEWPKGRHGRGYGRVWTGSREFAHRVAYKLAVGPIPEGMEILHKCDNPPCVRPDHLMLGTHDDNMKDAAAKGRTLHGERHKDAKLNCAQVQEIRRLYREGASQRKLGSSFGIDKSVVSRLVTRKTWKHVA
jgi:hypothetical protein